MARSLRVGAGSVRAVAMVLVACVVSIAWVSSASAATPGQSYAYTGDIGTPDAGNSSTLFTNTVGVSNDDGNVFIIRQGSPAFGQDPAIDVLDPATGTSISRPLTGAFLPRGVAVSADGSQFFMTDSFGSTTIQRYVRTSLAPLTYTQDLAWQPSSPLVGPQGIAVDPTTSDLVVSDGNRIARLDSATGTLLSSFDGSSNPSGRFSGPRSIAVAPNSDVYVVDDPGKVGHYAADGSWKGALSIPNPTVVATGVAVDPQNGDVAVELPSGYGTTDSVIRLYSAADNLKDVIRVPPAQVQTGGDGQIDNRGLAFAPDGSKLYVGLENGAVHVYSRGTQPGVDAPVAASITATEAHLSATVAPGNSAATARIEYCLASDPCEENLGSDGSSPWHQLPNHTGLTGSDPAHPGQDIIVDDATGLTPNTRYLLRTYAVNDASQVENRSATTSITTAVPPPAVTTLTANDVTDSSAELTGSVDNTYGAQTTYHFEYGLTSNYGRRLPASADGVAGNVRTSRTYTQIARGLQPGTTYHFRLVATNSAGSTAGADQTFTTLGVDQVAPHRGYEQVTAANKKGLAVLPNWGFQASADGSAFEYGGTSPSSDASSAAIVSRYVARRDAVASNWVGQMPLDPPFHSARALVNSVTLAVSDDFKHALVVSQVALTPGATEGAANIYVRDLVSGAYSLVGVSTDDGSFNGLTGLTRLDSFIAGAPDFSWVVMIVQGRLQPSAPQIGMYKWSRASGLSLISRLPNDAAQTGTLSLRTPNRMVSSDGTKAVFSMHNGDDGVYLRTGDETLPISVSWLGGNPGTTAQPAAADGISRDGNIVVFHSATQITDDDQDGGMSEYRYDVLLREMTYLGPQDGVNGGQGDTLGISDDGDVVYFDSNGQAVVWRQGQPGLDMVSSSALRGGARGASPNGRYYEYNGSDQAVYLYDLAAGDSKCLSCTAGGTPKLGHLPIPDNNISNRLPQSITDDGHAYFDTPAPLLSVDRNGTDDVYEYYRGRLTLISPGDRDFAAQLADISADGSNVYFATAEGLVSQDTDQTYDIYDARVGGGLAGQNPPPPDAPCAKTECAEPGPGPTASPPVGSLPQAGSKSKRTNQAKVKLSITRVAIGSKSMKITFHASQRGRVKVSGSRVATTYRNVSKEGTYSISVPLSKKARSLRHTKAKFKLAVKVSLAGGWGTASVKYSRTLNK